MLLWVWDQMKNTLWDYPTFKDGQASKFLEAMKNNVDFSSSEKGVRLYKLHADCFNPLTFWLTEEWNTVSDLKNHFLSESYIKNAELTAGKVLKQNTYYLNIGL